MSGKNKKKNTGKQGGSNATGPASSLHDPGPPAGPYGVSRDNNDGAGANAQAEDGARNPGETNSQPIEPNDSLMVEHTLREQDDPDESRDDRESPLLRLRERVTEEDFGIITGAMNSIDVYDASLREMAEMQQRMITALNKVQGEVREFSGRFSGVLNQGAQVRQAFRLMVPDIPLHTPPMLATTLADTPSENHEPIPSVKGKGRAVDPVPIVRDARLPPLWEPQPGESVEDFHLRMATVFGAKHVQLDRKQMLRASGEPEDGDPSDGSSSGGREPSPTPSEKARRDFRDRYIPDPDRDPEETSQDYRERLTRKRRYEGPGAPTDEELMDGDEAYLHHRAPLSTRQAMSSVGITPPTTTNVRFQSTPSPVPMGDPISVGPSISARIPTSRPPFARSDVLPSSASMIQGGSEFIGGDGSIVPRVPRVGMIGQRMQDRERLIERFERKLGRELKNPPNQTVAKNYKFEIAKYKGEDDYDILEQFCIDMFRMMRIMHLSGPSFEIDDERVELIGNNLKGKAVSWFNREIDLANHEGKTMTTKDVIRGLYDRFVHRSTASTAIDKYSACHYVPDQGIAAFYDELIFLAGKLVQMPSTYSIRKKFWDSIPARITSKLMIPYGLSPEESSMQVILTTALHIERSLEELKRQDETRKGQGSSRTAGDHAVRTSSDARTTDGDHLPRPRERSRGRDRGRSRSQERGYERDRDRSRDRGTREGEHSARDSRNIVRPNPTTVPQPKTASTRPATPPKVGPNQCRLCGKEGHWSNECPRRNTYTRDARINAARLEIDEQIMSSAAATGSIHDDRPQFDNNAGMSSNYTGDYDSDYRAARGLRNCNPAARVAGYRRHRARLGNVPIWVTRTTLSFRFMYLRSYRLEKYTYDFENAMRVSKESNIISLFYQKRKEIG